MYFKLEEVLISDVNRGRFRVREVVSQEHIQALLEDYEKSNTLLDPIDVWSNNGSLELLDGEHRIIVYEKKGNQTILAKVWYEMTEEEALLFILRKVTLKKVLSPIEEAKAILRYIENYNISQKEISEKLSRSQMWVSTRLSILLDTSDVIREYVKKGELSFSKAQIVAKLDKKKQKKFADMIIKNNLTLEETKKEYDYIVNPLAVPPELEKKIDVPKKVELKEEKKEFIITKRTPNYLFVENQIDDINCKIKIGDLDMKRFFCETHNSIFCRSIISFIKKIDKKEIEKIPFVEDEEPIKEVKKPTIMQEITLKDEDEDRKEAEEEKVVIKNDVEKEAKVKKGKKEKKGIKDRKQSPTEKKNDISFPDVARKYLEPAPPPKEVVDNGIIEEEIIEEEDANELSNVISDVKLKDFVEYFVKIPVDISTAFNEYCDQNEIVAEEKIVELIEEFLATQT
jgi:ParB family chromosome partitioning protein